MTTHARDDLHENTGLDLRRLVQEATVSDPVSNLLKQRSMLVILIAACSTARTAFEAADNAVDSTLLTDLSTMIERSERELEKLDQQIRVSS